MAAWRAGTGQLVTGSSHGGRAQYTLSSGGTERGSILGMKSAFTLAALLTIAGCKTDTSANDTAAVDPDTAPASYELSPPTGAAGTSMTVTVESTRSTFRFGDSWIDLGDGITVDSITVKDGFTAEADITIDPTAEVGGRDALVTIGELEVTLEESFSIVDQSFVIDPDNGKMGEALRVALVGQGTGWQQDFTWVDFGHGVDILDFDVLSPTLAEAWIAIHPDAPPGSRDVATENGPVVTWRYKGFTVDRAVITAFWEPESAYQGDTVAFTVEGLDTNFTAETVIEFFDDGGPNSDIEITELTWLDGQNLYGRIRLSNAARIGWRDVLITSGEESILLPDAMEVLDAPADLSNLYPVINFDVNRAINNADGSLQEDVSAFAYFIIPLSPPCGSPPPPGSGPMPYDANGVFPVPPEAPPDDCPNPETVSVGEYLWYEGPENIVTLHRDEIQATGQIIYRGIDLTLDDYRFDMLYDIHAPGDEDSGVPEFLVPEVQPTVPADYYIVQPELWNDFTQSRAESLDFGWTPAQTYPDAIFSVSIGGVLVANGEPGFAGTIPWDDGEHFFAPGELSQLEATPSTFSASSYIEGPLFGLPFSTIQTAQSDSTLSTSGQLILE